MLTIGITGPTGAGKSTFLAAVRRSGGRGIDCDALYYELLKTDALLRQKLTDAFGAVFLPDGSLERKKLGAKVFSDEAAKSTLNAIVFPVMRKAVLAEIERAKTDKIPLLGIDAVNLLPSGLAALCDVTVAVVCDENRRLSRIMQRDGISAAYATARIKSQENAAFFSKNCTKTLKNDAATEAAFSAVCDEFLQKIIKEYKK